MKRLFLVLCVCLQAFVSSAAMAWSPLDVYRSVDESSPQCISFILGSEVVQEDNKKEKEEEEEPDCD